LVFEAAAGALLDGWEGLASGVAALLLLQPKLNKPAIVKKHKVL
jgi:hypothetical protein